MKVLHLPTTVGGMNWGLAQGEKKLGLDSKVLITENNWLNYPFDVNLEWDKKSRTAKFYSSIKTFYEIRNKFDVFHFNFGTSLIDFSYRGINLWDIPFYPGSKKIVFTYNGCDARQKFKTMERARVCACAEQDCNGGICNSGALDVLKRKRIAKAARYANHMFAVNPDLLYFLPEGKSSFLPYAIARWYDIKTLPYVQGKRLKILHAPTNRACKGSSYILSAVDSLKKRHSADAVIVENLSNDQALKAYAQADIVIDQVLVGWYGGFAVEVMKMGKPVAVFIRDEDLKFIPPQMAADLMEAVINVNPDNIEEVLSLYLDNPRLLEKKSRAALEYVNKWHDPAYVAGITKAVYEK